MTKPVHGHGFEDREMIRVAHGHGPGDGEMTPPSYGDGLGDREMTWAERSGHEIFGMRLPGRAGGRVGRRAVAGR